MRYATFVIIPVDGGLTETDRRFGTTEGVTRRSIQHLNRLADETVVTIFELDGDIDAIQDVLSTSAEVLEYNISRTRDSYHVYIHIEPNETVADLLAIPNEYELVVDTPLVYTPRGGLRVTVFGAGDTLQAALPALPDTLRFKLEHLGEYEPTNERLFSLLTERQQEILQAAVQQGYYDLPRRATHQDIADSLDLTASTVGEHLRKIEAKLLSELTP